MKVRVLWNYDGTGPGTWEDLKLPDTIRTDHGAEQYAKGVLKRFNAELRPGEPARVFIDCEIEDDGQKHGTREPHQWRKISLITEAGGYDRMGCIVCGCTGKRHGLGQSGVELDRKYRNGKWYHCPGKQ